MPRNYTNFKDFTMLLIPRIEAVLILHVTYLTKKNTPFFLIGTNVSSFNVYVLATNYILFKVFTFKTFCPHLFLVLN